jgi:hypothetical protein
MSPAVYVQTNDATGNEVIAFSRTGNGALAPLGRYSTGGRGTGSPHLASAGSVVLSDDGRWLLVVNAGSDELSLFAVQPDGLRLAGRAIHADAQKLFGWAVGQGGQLTPVGEFGGVPGTVAGLAAS